MAMHSRPWCPSALCGHPSAERDLVTIDTLHAVALTVSVMPLDNIFIASPHSSAYSLIVIFVTPFVNSRPPQAKTMFAGPTWSGSGSLPLPTQDRHRTRQRPSTRWKNPAPDLTCE